MTIPPWIKGWIPPNAYFAVDRVKRGRTGLGDLYSTWARAKAEATGYEDTLILERVTESARRNAANGPETSFERDGVVVSGNALPFPLLACLLRSTINRGDGQLMVIDFGGSLGSSYHQCAPFLDEVARLTWRVVEQPHYVARGRSDFTTEHLTFHETLKDAARASQPDVIVFSGVLQYLDEPPAILAEAVALRPRSIIIDRTPAGPQIEEAYTVQYVPADIFKARLAFRIFGAGQLDGLLPGYRRVATFDTVDPDMRSGHLLVKFTGALYERIEAVTAGTPT
jgi:putative methyltransferase (TIGR04325 family)